MFPTMEERFSFDKIMLKETREKSILSIRANLLEHFRGKLPDKCFILEPITEIEREINLHIKTTPSQVSNFVKLPEAKLQRSNIVEEYKFKSDNAVVRMRKIDTKWQFTVKYCVYKTEISLVERNYLDIAPGAMFRYKECLELTWDITDEDFQDYIDLFKSSFPIFLHTFKTHYYCTDNIRFSICNDTCVCDLEYELSDDSIHQFLFGVHKCNQYLQAVTQHIKYND